jgi:Protein of unknown function (DUF4197)
MKKLFLITIILSSLFGCFNSNAQILKDAKKFVDKNTGGLSEKDAADGIREALVKGTGESVKLVANVDGYFGNPQIKIPFPPEAKEIESKLRAMGMGKKVDEVVLSLNRAAEDAGNEAKPIFIDAIKGMSISDAIKIVKGENDAATKYLSRTTSPQLNAKFQPVIKTSLDKVDATKQWEELVKTYNKIPFVKKMNPNLPAYVTGKAIDGLFIMVAKEELKIRQDPMARTSEILKKVFGN